jgi:hypothetical protein
MPDWQIVRILKYCGSFLFASFKAPEIIYYYVYILLCSDFDKLEIVMTKPKLI